MEDFSKQSRYGDSISSGYSADEESCFSPIIVDLLSKRKITDKKMLAKRWKLSERNYLAQTVKECIEKDGQEYPSLDITRPTIIPTLSFAGVQLVPSSSVTSSPFLIPQTSEKSVHEHDDIRNSELTYRYLITKYSHAYANNGLHFPLVSSISEENSNDGCNDVMLNENGSLIIQQNTILSKASSIFQKSLSIGEAMSVRNVSRFITLAKAPYEVIFSNSAYTSLTGLSSNEILGKPLFELLLPSSDSSLETSDSNLNVVCRAKSLPSGVKCFMSVTPIVPSSDQTKTDGCDKKTITHLVMDFTKFDIASNNNNKDGERLSWTMVG